MAAEEQILESDGNVSLSKSCGFVHSIQLRPEFE
jgi:hypothetical protein